MRIVFSVFTLTAMVGLILFNHQQYRYNAKVSRVIGELGQVINLQGRQRFNVQSVFADETVGSAGSMRWLSQIQSTDLLFSAPDDGVYLHPELLADWPYRDELIAARDAIERANRRFLQRDFSAADEAEIQSRVRVWKDQFMALTAKKQELDGQFARYLTDTLEQEIQGVVYLNLMGVTGFFFACFGAFSFHQRQYVRQVRNAERESQVRQDELQRSRNVFRSLAEDLSREREALQRAEERYRNINHLLPVGLMVVSKDGKITDANVQACQLFGYELEELLGMGVERLVPEDRRAGHAKLRDNFNRVQGPRIMAQNLSTLAGQHRDGSLIPLEIGLAPITLRDDPFIVVSLINVSERRKSLQQLQEKNIQMDLALEKLRQSNEQLERFAFICSHDLQEPVRMVVSFSQLLEKRIASQLDGKALQYLHFITDGASRARDMIKDILTFCRLDQNTEAHSIVDLEAVCEQVHNALLPAMEEKRAEFVWSDNLPSVEGVPSQMFQLLLNLVGNGIKFNRSAKPRVEVNATEAERHWDIAVTDNGIGIDQRYIDKLFQLFSRLNAKTEFPGSGIGLAICKKIVDQHRGGIRIESQADRGSRFIVTWPRIAP